ncbi:outer membrane beta-barrel protein [Flavisolibacter sp. BT320]|nr:outer membrane beta-barrel protein [Flavisolibacter longurius]
MRSMKIGVMLAASLFVGVAASAQYRGTAQAVVQHSLGIPMGSLKSAAPDVSARGARVALYFGINDNLAIGGGAAYQDFYHKKDRALYKLEDGSDISAVRSYSIQTIPILFESKWSFSPGKAIQPYVGLGIGGNLVNYNDYLGEFGAEQKTSFGFAARPHAGVYIPFRKHGESGFTLSGSYSIMPFKTTALSNLNHIGIHAGVTLPMRK